MLDYNNEHWQLTYYCWQTLTKDRPTLSSGRAPPQRQNKNCQTVINIWSWAPDGVRRQDLLIDWPSVAMWLWLWLWLVSSPCGGGVEYLHRDPASRKRRRKGKSQNWDSKIWSRDPRDKGPRKTALARTNSIYKRQIRPLVREGASEKQDHTCQRVINTYLVMSPRWGSTPRLTDWLTVSRNVTSTSTSTST
jgi:hypothetical protein